MKLTDLYKSILESLGLFVDEKGAIKLEAMPGTYIPISINDKNLILPTEEVLANPNWNVNMAFHPLSENIARKDSPVFKKLQNFVNISLNAELSHILSHMVELCSDKDKHKTMNHKQVGFLALYPNADDTSFKNWDKITSKLNDTNTLVKVITLRDKKLNNETFPRVTTVKFPFYDELMKLYNSKTKEYIIFGVKLRKKDVEGLKGLFEFIIEGVDSPDTNYSFGTRNNVAPSFHSLMMAYVQVKRALVKTANLLKLDTLSLHWVDALNDLSKYKGHIPPLDGNEGEVVEGEKRKAMTAVTNNTPQPVVQPQQSYTSPQVYNPQPVQPVQPQAPVTQPVKQVSNTGYTSSWMPAKPAVPPAQPAVTAPVSTPIVSQPIQQPMVPAQAPQMNPAMMNPAMMNPAMMQYMMQQQMMQQPQVRYNAQGQPVDQNGRPITGYQTAAQYAMQVNPVATQQALMQQQMMQGYNNPMMGNPMGMMYR